MVGKLPWLTVHQEFQSVVSDYESYQYLIFSSDH
jgi:hypothetical protein